jgi:hypothetical protein
MHGQRLKEISKLITYRHGGVVPYTNDADIYAEVVADHFAYNDATTVEQKLKDWCSLFIADMPEEQVAQIARNAVPRGFRLTADAVARRLNVT